MFNNNLIHCHSIKMKQNTSSIDDNEFEDDFDDNLDDFESDSD
jgi:hypothetical protein